MASLEFDGIDAYPENYQKSGFTKAIENMPLHEKIALGTAPIPIVGDIAGLFSDFINFQDDPSWANAGWMALGALPFVPAGSNLKEGFEQLVRNMPNERPNFYKGGLPGRAYDTVAAVGTGLKNSQLQRIDPQARANWRAEGISKTTQDVMQTKADMAKRFDEVIPMWEEYVRRNPNDQEAAMLLANQKTARRQLEKQVQGQLQQDTLFKNQYKNERGSLLENQEFLNYADKGFSSPEEFLRMTSNYAGTMDVPQEDLFTIFRAIRQNQKVGFPQEVLNTTTGGKVDLRKPFPVGADVPMMMKRSSANAAGDLNADIKKMSQKGINGEPIRAYATATKVLTSRPFEQGLSGLREFKELAQQNLSKNVLDKFEKNGVYDQMFEALQKYPELRQATSADAFVDILKDKKLLKTGGLSETNVKKLFATKAQQPFKSNAHLIQALENNNVKVFNKAKVLEDPTQPVIISGSHNSDAWELGGVNTVTAVYPNGKMVSFVGDQNDVMGVGAPYGGRMLTISEPLVEHYGMGTLPKARQDVIDFEKGVKQTNREMDTLEVMDRLGMGDGKAQIAAREGLAQTMFPPTKSNSSWAQIAAADAVRGLQADVLPADRRAAMGQYLFDTLVRARPLAYNNEDVQP